MTDRSTDVFSHDFIKLSFDRMHIPFKDSECGSRDASITETGNFTSMHFSSQEKFGARHMGALELIGKLASFLPHQKAQSGPTLCLYR